MVPTKFLNSEKLLDSIQTVLHWFVIGYTPVYPEPAPGTVAKPEDNPPVVWQQMTKEDIARLTVVLNTTMRLLAKTLPDLKSIDFTDSSVDRRKLSDLELAQRVSSLVGSSPLAPVHHPAKVHEWH